VALSYNHFISLTDETVRFSLD